MRLRSELDAAKRAGRKDDNDSGSFWGGVITAALFLG